MNRFIIFCSCVIVAAILVATTFVASQFSSSNYWPLDDTGIPIVIVEAEEMINNRAPAEAIAHLQPFLDDNDKEWTPYIWDRALYVKGEAAIDLKNYDEAVTILTEVISDRSIEEQRSISGAESDYARLIKFAYFYRMKAYFGSKNYEKAMGDIEHLLNTNPSETGLYGWAGVVYLNEGNLNQSLDYFNKSIETNKDWLLERAEVFVYLGEFENAMKDVNEAERLASPDPGELNYVFNRKGFVLNSFQQYSEAIITLNDAIANDPAFASPYYHRAVANSFLGNLEQAQADFDKALELGYDPDYATRMYPSLEPFSTNIDTSGGTSGNSTAGTISDTVAKSLSAGSSSLTQPTPNPAATNKVSESTPKSSSSAPALSSQAPSVSTAPPQPPYKVVAQVGQNFEQAEIVDFYFSTSDTVGNVYVLDSRYDQTTDQNIRYIRKISAQNILSGDIVAESSFEFPSAFQPSNTGIHLNSDGTVFVESGSRYMKFSNQLDFIGSGDKGYGFYYDEGVFIDDLKGVYQTGQKTPFLKCDKTTTSRPFGSPAFIKVSNNDYIQFYPENGNPAGIRFKEDGCENLSVWSETNFPPNSQLVLVHGSDLFTLSFDVSEWNSVQLHRASFTVDSETMTVEPFEYVADIPVRMEYQPPNSTEPLLLSTISVGGYLHIGKDIYDLDGSKIISLDKEIMQIATRQPKIRQNPQNGDVYVSLTQGVISVYDSNLRFQYSVEDSNIVSFGGFIGNYIATLERRPRLLSEGGGGQEEQFVTLYNNDQLRDGLVMEINLTEKGFNSQLRLFVDPGYSRIFVHQSGPLHAFNWEGTKISEFGDGIKFYYSGALQMNDQTFYVAESVPDSHPNPKIAIHEFNIMSFENRNNILSYDLEQLWWGEMQRHGSNEGILVAAGHIELLDNNLNLVEKIDIEGAISVTGHWDDTIYAITNDYGNLGQIIKLSRD